MKLINVKPSLRVKAFFWDMVMSIPFFALGLIVFFICSHLFSRETADKIVESGILERLFIFTYLLIFELFTKNGSVGKKIMKVKVVNLENDSRPSFGRMLLRGVGNLLSFVDLLFCYKRLDRRSLGDLISKTRVVYATGEQKIKYEGKREDDDLI